MCTLVQALRLCTGHMAHRGSRGIALLFYDNGTRRGWGVSVTPRPLFNPGKDPVSIAEEAGWAPGPVWKDAENLAPPPGFDPRTVQPVASRYTDWATQPTHLYIDIMEFWYTTVSTCGPGSSVGIATDYRLDDLGIESRWGRDFPHLSRPAPGPTQPPVQWVPGLSSSSSPSSLLRLLVILQRIF
jgi:hypothetical protein